MRFFRNTQGTTAIEYALIAALVGAALAYGLSDISWRINGALESAVVTPANGATIVVIVKHKDGSLEQ